jgi:hypothetical protein
MRTERLRRRGGHAIPAPIRERLTGETITGAAFLLVVAAIVPVLIVALILQALGGGHGDALLGVVVGALLLAALVALLVQGRSRPLAAVAAGAALTFAAFAPGHLTAFEHLLTLNVSSPLHASVTVNSPKGRPATVQLTGEQAHLLSNDALKISAGINQVDQSIRHLTDSTKAETRAESRSEKRIADALEVLSRYEP